MKMKDTEKNKIWTRYHIGAWIDITHMSGSGLNERNVDYSFPTLLIKEQFENGICGEFACSNLPWPYISHAVIW